MKSMCPVKVSSPSTRVAAAGISLAMAFGVPGTACADLLHRYSFNDGSANDSVGAAHGVLIAPATISGGVLNTAPGGFVTLPDSATTGINADLTIEQWYRWNGGGGPQISFCFGNDTSNYFLAHPAYNGGHSVEYAPQGAHLVASSPPTGTLIHLVTTYTASIGEYRMFVNGVLVDSSVSGAFNLETTAAGRSDIGGRGAWNDPRLNGSTDEFRIWNSALTPEQIAEHFVLGPNLLPCRPDLNSDHELDFFDVQQFLSLFAASDPAADFTNDGEFNFFDVQAFLQAFSAGCP